MKKTVLEEKLDEGEQGRKLCDKCYHRIVIRETGLRLGFTDYRKSSTGHLPDTVESQESYMMQSHYFSHKARNRIFSRVPPNHTPRQPP